MLKEMMLKSLKTAISSVLETMFFQPVQMDNSNCKLQDWLSKDKPLLGATLDFNGPFIGRCCLLLPVELIKEMTANFLGLEEEEVIEEQEKDTLKEALNMIGGQMLSLADKEGVCQLGIPELVDENSAHYDRLDDLEGDMLLIETGEYHLAAGIYVE